MLAKDQNRLHSHPDSSAFLQKSTHSLARSAFNQQQSWSTFVTIVHDKIAGRTRFHMHELHRNSPLLFLIENEVECWEGVHSATGNILTGNLLVRHSTLLSSIALLNSLKIALPELVKLSKVSASQHQTFRSLAADQRFELLPPSEVHSWHVQNEEDIIQQLETSRTDGLSTKIALERLKKNGANVFQKTQRRSRAKIFLEQFQNLPAGLLTGTALLSAATGGMAEGAVVLGTVLLNALIGSITEENAEKTIASLSGDVEHSVSLFRSGKVHSVPEREVVVGDLLILRPGCYIPADARLIGVNQLTIDESALTGESMPVAKTLSPLALETLLADRTNMVYRGTFVTGGNALAIVVATSHRTELGKVQALLSTTQKPEIPLEGQLRVLGTQLVYIASLACGGVFLQGLLRGYKPLPMVKTSLSLAVAAIPEGLPTLATTMLALGVRNMRGLNVLVRHLGAVEALGAVNTICLDKTGTLTLNKMAVSCIALPSKVIPVSGHHFTEEFGALSKNHRDDLLKLAQISVLCNETKVTWESGQWMLDGSATEAALVRLALQLGMDTNEFREQFPLQEVGYRSENRLFMTTLHKGPFNKKLLAVKGSPQDVLARCHLILSEGQIVPLSKSLRKSIAAQNEKLGKSGLRVLGFAYLESELEIRPEEKGLIWLGLAGLNDPPREGVKATMKALHGAGIRTLMLTGDQCATAQSLGEELGLSNGSPLQLLAASDFENFTDEERTTKIKSTHVFARVTPSHKLQIIQALQAEGVIVAMAGDGVNDGPALKAADIGIAMGEHGTKVAQDVADVVLTDDNLETLVSAIKHGRNLYDNIRKSIRFVLTTNASELLLMFIGLSTGMGQPLNSMQLLWINLVSDVFPVLALALDPAEEEVMQRAPRFAQEKILNPADLSRIFLESLVLTSVPLLTYAYELRKSGPGKRAETIAFTSLTGAQLLHTLSCRSDRNSIFNGSRTEGRSLVPLSIVTGALLQGLAVFAPWTQKLLGTTKLGTKDLLTCGASASLTFLINEGIKQYRNGQGRTQQT